MSLAIIQSKLVAAQQCHPAAVQTLIAEALQELDKLTRQPAEPQVCDNCATEGKCMNRQALCPIMLGRKPWTSPPPAQPRLKVRLTAFPETNGKRNWTALLVREQSWGGLVGNCGGISLARGELWNRVAWEAECARFLIGERDTEPSILDYGDDIKTPEEWKGERDGGRRQRPHVEHKKPDDTEGGAI